jgi:hypothetical protein
MDNNLLSHLSRQRHKETIYSRNASLTYSDPEYILLREKHKQHHKCAYRRKGSDQDVSGTTEYAKEDAKDISGIPRLFVP